MLAKALPRWVGSLETLSCPFAFYIPPPPNKRKYASPCSDSGKCLSSPLVPSFLYVEKLSSVLCNFSAENYSLPCLNKVHFIAV